MFKKIIIMGLFLLNFNTNVYAQEVQAWDVFDYLEALEGEWTLSPASKQLGTLSYKKEAVLPLVGTDAVGISFKVIGGFSTIEEELLPNTRAQMVTMYHCKDIACTKLKATHYCVKQNQPEFLANLEKSTATRIILECDMSTQLCQSKEDHVHTIIHELSNNFKHLKSSYLSWENKKPKNKSSIYHFDKRIQK
ncbi:hypothetical protein JHD50_11500 [Sulfurimonas sp. MAG313]|nr:hypothetical protein [Sulfurimonas sp. MAG313]MDF1881914.1 hypothetical protein [Sulfurimonas sp. MAG313]